MCPQLDLEVICKRSKKKGIPSNFHEFRSEEVHYKNYPKRKEFQSLNLVDLME
jgi:hypothetical protein